MQILITGGAGFIGSHVVDGLLARGHTVVVVDDFNDFYDPALKRRNTAGFGERATVVDADTYADISKAKRLLGYDPQVGIRRFVDWFREQL
jgi:nucleoside-diphosphate-sugar epimerase